MPAADGLGRSALDDHAKDTTSLTLLSRVRKADQLAWTRLVQLYGPLVFDWCRRWGLSASDAADIGQEVFTRVWGAIQDFRRDQPGDSFRAWLRVIARRQVLDFWRRQQRQPPLSPSTDVVDQLPAFPHDDEGQLADDRRFLHGRALELLRSDFESITVEAFWRVVVDGRSPREVAEELGVSINAVYIAKSRVLTRLRAELSDNWSS